jgi:flagellar basal-body rod protein FlgB
MIDSVSLHLERYHDLLSIRQKVVASNIANLNTPGYRARDIDFQNELSRAVENGPDAEVRPEVVRVQGLDVKNDGNNVQLEREAKLLAENAMRFEVVTSMLNKRHAMIRTAIKEGNA